MSQHAPHHAALGAKSSRSRLLVGVLATVVTLGTLVGVAFAFWQTTDSSHPAAASATSLSQPSVTATEASATSVKVSWTAGSQPTGTQYQVIRNPGASQVTVCTVPASTSNCIDSGLSSATTYNYSVTAVLGDVVVGGHHVLHHEFAHHHVTVQWLDLRGQLGRLDRWHLVAGYGHLGLERRGVDPAGQRVVLDGLGQRLDRRLPELRGHWWHREQLDAQPAYR